MMARFMSLNAVSNLNSASIRETPDASSGSLNNLRSTGRRDSFSQVLRRTSEDQKSSGTARIRDSEKKDRKPAKKEDDANSTTATDIVNKTVEEKRLPITFLLGLPSGQLQSFDPKENSDAPISQIDAKSGGTAAENGANMLLLPQALDIASSSSFVTGSEKSDPRAATAEGTEVLGIGESGNNSKGAVGALSANALAFALRLGSGGQALSTSKTASSVESVSPAESDNTQTNFAPATPDAIQAASGSTLEQDTHQHDESGQQQNVIDLSAVGTPELFDTTKLADEHATAPTAQVPTEPAVPTAEPVRNVHMQLVSDDNRRVDVRLVDRGGELHVSVKSADTALTQNLQDHLPDLTARLDKQHMQTEVWVPKAAEPSKADGGNTNGSFSDPNARSYSGNSQGRREGRQQAKPDWVDALENYS
jgi:hypothetical protein